MNTKTPQARHKGLVIREVADEVLVYDLDTNKAHCLNHSAAFVWKHCNGNHTVRDIVRHFEGAGSEVTEDFVWLAIDQLSENGLLAEDFELRFPPISRRRILREVGMAAAVALPIVASLAAPKSALATVSCGCSCAPGLNCPDCIGCPSTNCNPAGICIA